MPSEFRQVGSIADYDPMNGNWGTIAASKNAEKIGNKYCKSIEKLLK